MHDQGSRRHTYTSRIAARVQLCRLVGRWSSISIKYQGCLLKRKRVLRPQVRALAGDSNGLPRNRRESRQSLLASSLRTGGRSTPQLPVLLHAYMYLHYRQVSSPHHFHHHLPVASLSSSPTMRVEHYPYWCNTIPVRSADMLYRMRLSNCQRCRHTIAKT